MEDELIGEYGTAELIPRENWPDKHAQLAAWIITAPCWHPLWYQYMIATVSLAPFPGLDPPILKFPGATHELMVVTLSPDSGPYDAPTTTPGNPVKFMEPFNICEQFVTTDERAIELCAILVEAVVNGMLCPETIEDPAGVRAFWSTAVHQTLDHFKDPHHGAMN